MSRVSNQHQDTDRMRSGRIKPQQNQKRCGAAGLTSQVSARVERYVKMIKMKLVRATKQRHMIGQDWNKVLKADLSKLEVNLQNLISTTIGKKNKLGGMETWRDSTVNVVTTSLFQNTVIFCCKQHVFWLQPFHLDQI